ncbi:hypothetical protein PoB_002739600 [Plakobranchus ocellatus]|uniref:Uncharacterized protein n=1 Tax=Plakobranchus ocellatus TaxID=259542 RepID=A0AAV3ZYA6_9GAST|nr:hypothetical protein PoB_002739600 [Plakobranchus ocellatus]
MCVDGPRLCSQFSITPHDPSSFKNDQVPEDAQEIMKVVPRITERKASGADLEGRSSGGTGDSKSDLRSPETIPATGTLA